MNKNECVSEEEFFFRQRESDYLETITKQRNELEELKARFINPKFSDEEIWLQAWNSYASSSNSINKYYAKDWANECLENYKVKFPEK